MHKCFIVLNQQKPIKCEYPNIKSILSVSLYWKTVQPIYSQSMRKCMTMLFGFSKSLGKNIAWFTTEINLTHAFSELVYKIMYLYKVREKWLQYCYPGHQLKKTDDRWNRENKEFLIHWLIYYTRFSIEKRYWCTLFL